MTPLEDLLRTLAPPLEYLASAPPSARAGLPLKAIHEKLARTSAAVDDMRVRAALGEVRELLGRLAAGRSVADAPTTGPVDDAIVAAEPAASDALRRMLELLRTLRNLPAAEAAGEYRRSGDSVRPQLEALRMPVQFVKGVGPKRAAQLAKLGITTVEDLLFHLPFRYEDRRDVGTIGTLRPGDETTVEAVLRSIDERWGGRGRRRVLEAIVARRHRRARARLVQPAALLPARAIARGQRVLVHGRVEPLRQAALGRGLAPLRIVHPEIEILEGEERAEHRPDRAGLQHADRRFRWAPCAAWSTARSSTTRRACRARYPRRSPRVAASADLADGAAATCTSRRPKPTSRR